MLRFRTSNGEIITGQRLEIALDKVASWYENNANEIRNSDEYASHVTEEQKDECLLRCMEDAERLRKEGPSSFDQCQRLNFELTGECIPFLPKE